jgi:hypothetical protein
LRGLNLNAALRSSSCLSRGLGCGWIASALGWYVQKRTAGHGWQSHPVAL